MGSPLQRQGANPEGARGDAGQVGFSRYRKEKDVEGVWTAVVYGTGIFFWLGFWRFHIRFGQFRVNPWLLYPFLGGLFFMGVNLWISGTNPVYGDSHLEEFLFRFLDARCGLVIGATSSILVVATIIYGASGTKFPLQFIRFEAFSFMSLLGVMVPLVWIPQGDPRALMLLRHCQTVGFLWGVFLCISGIMILLKDLLEMQAGTWNGTESAGETEGGDGTGGAAKSREEKAAS